MTKFVKMSLAAAVAVAGLSSTASAADMMMDKTSFSGKVYVEQIVKTDDKSSSSTDGNSVAQFDIDFDITGKSKINDTLTAVVGIQADGGKESENATENSNVDMNNAYFAYANKGLSVKMGRMDIETPNTDGEEGEGTFAAYTVGSITAAGAFFVNNAIGVTDRDFNSAIAAKDATDISKNSEVSALALLGSAGPINFELWQVSLSSLVSNTTAVLGGEFSGVSVEARHATTDYENKALKDGATTKLTIAGKVSNLGLTGIYFSTDKDNAAYVSDASSANAVELVNLTTDHSTADASIVALIGSLPVGEKGTVTISYGDGEVGKVDVSEYVLQYGHKIAKSTKMTVRYAGYEEEYNTGGDREKTHARVDVKYSF